MDCKANPGRREGGGRGKGVWRARVRRIKMMQCKKRSFVSKKGSRWDKDYNTAKGRRWRDGAQG